MKNVNSRLGDFRRFDPFEQEINFYIFLHTRGANHFFFFPPVSLCFVLCGGKEAPAPWLEEHGIEETADMLAKYVFINTRHSVSVIAETQLPPEKIGKSFTDVVFVFLQINS